MSVSPALSSLVLAGCLVAVAPTLVGCAATGPQEATVREFSSDEAGDQPVAGQVRIASVDRSLLATDGTVRYVLDNVSGADLQNLTARVIFYYPPTEQTDIALPFDTDVTEERSLVLFANQSGLEFVGESRAFAERSAAGETILATRIDVRVEELVGIFERDGVSPGTLLLNGRLECVGISDEDLRYGLDGAAPTLWLDFANLTARAVANIEMRVIFFDPDRDVREDETGLVKLADLAPGERGRIELDISGIDRTKLRTWRFLVRAVESSGLGF